MEVKIHNGIEKSQTLHFFLKDREVYRKHFSGQCSHFIPHENTRKP